MSKFFRQRKFDAVHVNGSYQFKVAIAAKLARIPVVWHLNDTLMSSVIKKAFYLTARVCANGFIVAGKRVHDYYLENTKLSSRPCIEIHAPVDTSIFHPREEEDESNICRTISTVSGVNPAKGVEYFVDMVSHINKSYPHIKFNVAGAKLESQKKYSEFIKNKIDGYNFPDGVLNFLGLIEDVPSFLHDADICVFTSVTEASPTSVWEAMSMGKPIVTTDVGSVSQYIENGVTGFIVPIEDVEGLCEKIIMLIDDPDLRKRMGKKAMGVALTKLNIITAARKHAEIYNRII